MKYIIDAIYINIFSGLGVYLTFKRSSWVAAITVLLELIHPTSSVLA